MPLSGTQDFATWTLLENPTLGVALRLARESGELLHSRTHDLQVTTKSTATDVVTDMDKKSEDHLVAGIIAAFPEDGIMGEEGTDRPSTSGRQWVIDPLDGTVNYLYGLPAWCVSVAVVDESTREGIVGVVDAPALGVTFVAVRDCGAWRIEHGQVTQLKVSDCTDVTKALLGTGFGYSEQRRKGQARVIAELIPVVRDIRRAGACAIDLCWVAQGSMDAYFERGVNPWDHAAGGLIAREAGAIVSGLHGRREDEQLILASSPEIYPELIERLTALRADTDPGE